jgi:hypothetical protein
MHHTAQYRTVPIFPEWFWTSKYEYVRVTAFGVPWNVHFTHVLQRTQVQFRVEYWFLLGLNSDGVLNAILSQNCSDLLASSLNPSSVACCSTPASEWNTCRVSYSTYHSRCSIKCKHSLLHDSQLNRTRCDYEGHCRNADSENNMKSHAR